MRKKIRSIINILFVFSVILPGCGFRTRNFNDNDRTRNDSFGSKNFSILFLGDILLVRKANDWLEKKSSEYYFSRIKKDFENYTYLVANLETPVSRRGYPEKDKKFVFRIEPAMADSLVSITPTCLTIGNNHILDFGEEGLLDTIEWISSKHWLYTGAGVTIENARIPAIINHGKVKVVILSYNERPPFTYSAGKKKSGTVPFSMDIIKEDIQRWKKENTIVIINPHWGIELTLDIQPYQRKIAHKIIDFGADAIIGHHPHWPQGVEVYKDKPIVYSLGNFVSGFYLGSDMDNIAVSLYYSDSKFVKMRIIPISGINSEIECSPYVVKSDQGKKDIEMISNLSKKLNTKVVIEDTFGYAYPNQ